MGMLDNNIHMNGAGTTYQAFLDLADAAEEACNGKGARGNYLGLFAGTLLLSRFMPFDGLTADALGESVLAFADAALAVRAALVEPAAEHVPAPDADFSGERDIGKFISV